MIGPRVAIVVLNWNRGQDTVECIESIFRSSYDNYEVILLDNGSTDDSVHMIREFCKGNVRVNSWLFESSPALDEKYLLEYILQEAISGGDPNLDKTYSSYHASKRLKLIACDRNYGFAEGNNLAINHILRAAEPDYVIILNNDAVVDKDCISELVNAVQSDTAVGFASPKVLFYSLDGRRDVLQFAGGRLLRRRGLSTSIGKGEVDRGQFDIKQHTDYAAGSCMLVTRKMIGQVGLFDPRFFAYWEEVDWCVRGGVAGYKSLYVPRARIWHRTSSSSTASFHTYYMNRNRLLFMKKNTSPIDYMAFVLYLFFFDCWLETVRILIRHGVEIALLKSFLRGLFDGLRIRKSM
ncbi:MAG: glycosyltransferase family 2 protein [Candidatus Thermoplasmatota archaeon]|nr:glycosyltransferase family 2 protein [Candidatus Thermoplasmatota archaeon]